MELQRDSEVGHQSKQERSRTRWTASLDEIFADLVVEQIRLGNRPNNVFDKKTWNHIRDEFNKLTDLKFNNNQLRKHLDVLRTRYNNLKPAFDQNDFALVGSSCLEFDLWEAIEALPRPETIKLKDCPIYEQLCTIFSESGGDGKYAQSSHFEELDKFVGTGTAGLLSSPDGETLHSETPIQSRFVQGDTSSAEKAKNIAERKRKRQSETHTDSGQRSKDQVICDVMANAMIEIVAASRSKAVAAIQSDDRFGITNCIHALDEVKGIDEEIYYAALDLFEYPNLREMFISLKGGAIRLAWLRGKCGNASSS